MENTDIMKNESDGGTNLTIAGILFVVLSVIFAPAIEYMSTIQPSYQDASSYWKIAHYIVTDEGLKAEYMAKFDSTCSHIDTLHAHSWFNKK